MTPTVLEAQHRQYGAISEIDEATEPDPLGPDERDFIDSRDSFYMATVTETGWPYLQHRGGPAGFLRVIDDRTIAFADLAGNRQLLSTGNLLANDRVALFLMDYPGKRRLKIIGRATVEAPTKDSAIARSFASVAPGGVVERYVLIRVVGHDWNCPRHITPRYTEAEVDEYVASLKKRIAELEAERR